MPTQELALSNVIWAMLYVVLYYYLRKPILFYFKTNALMNVHYFIVLPVLLGINMGNAIANYLLLVK